MRKSKVFPLIILIISIGIISFSMKICLSPGDWLELNGKYDLPGAYIKDGKTFWRIDAHFESTALEYKGISITIESSETIGDDATVLFVDAGENEERVWGYLKKLLKSSKKFVYICVYDIDYSPFVRELKNIKKNGVDVKVISELNNKNPFCDELGPVYDSNPKLMHNKFLVIDGYAVVTGSLNFTQNGFKKNNNNVVVVFSNELAQEYMEEFQEMLDGTFGGGKFSPVLIRTDLGTIQPIFTPDDKNATEKIVSLIDRAIKSVHVMMFAFTSRDIAMALVRARNRGLDVRVIMEGFQASNRWSVYSFLKDNEVPVILDKNPGVFHHKVMIVDGKYTLTGSFNYTNSAQRYNDENFLIITDPSISKTFERKFEYYWQSWSKNDLQ